MKRLLIIIVSLIFSGICAQEPAGILDRISTSLPAYREAFPMEKVILHTDRDVYVPAENIWFSAQVAARSGETTTPVSPELTVAVYAADGTFICGDKFLVSGSQVSGDLSLPVFLPSGRYYLIAHTLLQVHPEEVFIKPIYVDQPYEQHARVTLANPNVVYQSGSSAQIDLLVSDPFGQPVDRYSFDYQLEHAGKTISAGKIRSTSGKAAVQLKIPDNAGSDPLKLMLTHPRNFWTEIFYLLTDTDKIQVRFYPEGGNLVHNEIRKMGFYVTAQGSVPSEIEADIQDNTGRVIGKTHTFAAGYGIFPIQVEPGKSYRMVITSEYGKGQFFPLPAVNPDKAALAISRPDNDFLIAEITTPDRTARKLAVAVTERSEMIWAAEVEITHSARIRIPVEDFSPGIQQITVFDQSGKVLSSRLTYTPEKNQYRLKITPQKTGNQVQIKLESSDTADKPVKSSLSVSVLDQSRIMPQNVHLQDYYRLHSELTNPVVHIRGLSDASAGMASDLDNILIINDLKLFSWEDVFNYDRINLADDILDKKDVKGKVTSRKGEAVSNALVTMLNNKNFSIYSAIADEKGEFFIPGVNPVDYRDYNLSATDEKGKGNHSVATASSFSDRVTAEIKNLDHSFAKYFPYLPPSPAYFHNNPDLVVKAPQAVRQASTGTAKQRNDSYKILLQTATSLAEVIKMMRPYTLMNGQIVFYGTINSINFQSGALIVVDGQKMGTSVEALSMIAPSDVESINISLDPMDIQKYTGFNSVAVIEIQTKKGGTIRSSAPSGSSTPMAELYKAEYRIARSFLSTPGFPHQTGRDFRGTLYWNPALQSDLQGTATVTLTLPDSKIRYIIVAEGMDNEGNFVTGNSVLEF